MSFLQLVRDDAFSKNANGLGAHSRSELISLFHSNFENKGDFSQILDLLFFNKLMDADSKQNGQFEGYFVTELGIDVLRHPDKFVLNKGELNRRAPDRVDATAWTGKKLILTDERAIIEVRQLSSELRERIYQTRFESNSDSQDLKSLADALVSVCAMAEPDLSPMERILAHPKFKLYATLTAGIAAIRGAIGF